MVVDVKFGRYFVTLVITFEGTSHFEEIIFENESTVDARVRVGSHAGKRVTCNV